MTKLEFQGKPIRFKMIGGKRWFVAKDVALALGYTWKGLKHTYPTTSEEHRDHVTIDTARSWQKVCILAEEGLSALLHRARKPVAKDFLEWLSEELGDFEPVSAEEVLPLVEDGPEKGQNPILGHLNSIGITVPPQWKERPPCKGDPLAKRAPVSFEFEGASFDVWDNGGKYYFPGTECARALGYANPRKALIDHCKGDGVTKRDSIDNMGRTQQKKYISEGNLYRLIVRSKLPSAEQFERKVFDEVLPAIRKTGTYSINRDVPPAPIPAPAEEYPGLFLYDRDGNRFVSARRLRDVLWLTTGFSGWIKFQTTRAGCVEGQDYRVITQGDGSFDFMLTVSTAICLAVVASSNRGREIRDYLSKSEEEWNTPAQVIDRALRLVQKQLTTDRN